MPDPEIVGLYNAARSRHMKRREQALSATRRAVTSPGWCVASIVSEQIRAWFDEWEAHLWKTYAQRCQPLPKLTQR